MSRFHFSSEPRRSAASSALHTLNVILSLRGHAALNNIDVLSAGLINYLNPRFDTIKVWAEIIKHGGPYTTVEELRQLDDSLNNVHAAFAELFNNTPEIVAHNRKQILESIETKCERAELLVHKLIPSFIYSKGLEEYSTFTEAIVRDFQSYQGNVSRYQTELEKKELAIRNREDELSELARQGAEEFTSDNKRLRWRLGLTALFIGLEGCGLFAFLYQWSGHADWLLTRDKEVNQFLFFYAGLSSKIVGSIAFITALLLTIRLFRSYLNMLELNHHRIALLKTLRPIALVAPASMRDAIYVKVIDLIARYDSLDQREVSSDVLDKLANSASMQGIITKSSN